MNLDLKRIQELEVEYKGNSISLNALENMINSVMFPQLDPMGWNNTSTYNLALNTLRELKVITDPKENKVATQLNS